MRALISILALSLVIAWPLASHAAGPDADGDGIPDTLDKCVLDSRNATSTCDSDSDGYGNPCDPDFDQDFVVIKKNDYAKFFVPRLKTGVDAGAVGADMDCDGTVTANDFSMYFVPKLKGALGGAKPGPSGLSCAGQAGCM